RCGGRVDADVKEIERARVRVWRAVRERELHAHRTVRHAHAAGALCAAQPLDIHRGLLEVDVDRIDLFHRREQRRRAFADQGALGDALLTGAAGDRRGDGGVTQVYARAGDAGLG